VLRPLELGNQHRQRTVEDDGGIASRDRVPEKVPRALKLVVRLLTDRDFDEVARGGERSDNGRRGWPSAWSGTARRRGQGRVCDRHDGPAVSRGRLVVHRPNGSDPERGVTGRRGQTPNARADIGLRIECGDETLDVALALVARGREQRRVVVVGQVGRQERDRRQRDVALSQLRQDRGEVSGRASRGDPRVRRRFREAEHVRAVREERGMSFAAIELPGVELGEKGHELGGRAAVGRDDAAGLGEELTIRHSRRCGDGHAIRCSTRFLTAITSRQRRATESDGVASVRVAEALLAAM
jgi:hypothetical protein